MSEIDVLVLEPRDGVSVLEARKVEASLEGLQGLVGGSIELVMIQSLARIGVTTYVNEDGKALGLEPTLGLDRDTIVGPIAFVGDDGEGEDVSLTASQVVAVMAFLRGGG